MVEDKIEVVGYGLKSKSLRKHWYNVIDEPDASILEIDRLEDDLEFQDKEMREKIYTIRRAITGFEFCHHKALHRLYILIRSIGRLEYLNKESSKEEKINNDDVKQWISAYKILKAWVDNDLEAVQNLYFFEMTALDLVSHLGFRNSLKEWQVDRLLENMFYVFLNFDDKEGKYKYFEGGEQKFQENNEECEFYRQTMDVKLEGLNNDLLGEMNLGKLIDLHFLCNWNYKQNLLSILQIMNGRIDSYRNIVICALNFEKHPSFNEFLCVKKSLRAYWDEDYHNSLSIKNCDTINYYIKQELGAKSPVKIWLVRSLERTLLFCEI